MSLGILLLLATIALLAVIVALIVVFYNRQSGGVFSGSSPNAVSTNLRAMVMAQRESVKVRSTEGRLAYAAAVDAEMSKKRLEAAYRLTLERRLKYAQLSLTTGQVRIIQGLIAALVFVLLMLVHSNNYIIATLFAFMAPIVISDLIDRRIKKRFNAFDKDFATFLMSYVSLLKTGMSTFTGIETAANGLDVYSLVRAEVHLLIERVKLGLQEDIAINSFGEDVYHPEIELFVQSVVLSRKLGGNLSNTLERLAKQVRKRSQFRSQAIAAVGMERNSLWGVLVVMGLMIGYLGFSAPDLMEPAITNSTGWLITQFCVVLVVAGIYVMKKITNIKV